MHRQLAGELDTGGRAYVLADEHDDLDGTCVGLVRALGESGFGAYAVPEARGNTEKLDVRSLCIIRETLARHNALADFAFAMQGLGSGPFIVWICRSTGALLKAVSKGEKISAFALSEQCGFGRRYNGCRAESWEITGR